MKQQNAPSDYAPLWRKGIPQSPKISVSKAAEDDQYEASRDKLVEVKGVGVAVSHPMLELENNHNNPPGTPMPHLSTRGKLTSITVFMGTGSSLGETHFRKRKLRQKQSKISNKLRNKAFEAIKYGHEHLSFISKPYG